MKICDEEIYVLIILFSVKLIEYLVKTKDTLVSFEVLPPFKGKTIAYIYEHLDQLMEFIRDGLISLIIIAKLLFLAMKLVWRKKQIYIKVQVIWYLYNDHFN